MNGDGPYWFYVRSKKEVEPIVYYNLINFVIGRDKKQSYNPKM